MKKISFTLALAIFSFISTAHANCIPSDVTGGWVMYQTNISSELPHTGRCDIKVADNAARSLTGNCSLSNGYEMVVTGNAKVGAACDASLKLEFTGGSMDFDMQLSADRQSFVGRWKNSFGDVGGTNGVRK